MQPKKKFLKKEKINIILEAKEMGVNVTLTKYNVIKSTYYYWVVKFAKEIQSKEDNNNQLDDKIIFLNNEIVELKEIIIDLQKKLLKYES